MDKIIEIYNSLPLESFKKRILKLSPDTLIKIKKNLDNRYYNSGEKTISDLKYDTLVEILREKDPSYIPQIGCKLREDDNTVLLPYHLGSMDKIKKDEIQKLENWKKDNNNKNYIISDKLNGVSCLMVFNEKENLKIYTRGDGSEGADISYLYEKIPNIPNIKNQDIVVRGELIIKQKIFDEKYAKTYKNSLSLIVGNINSKTLKQALSEGDIRFIAYEVINSGQTPEENLENLKKLNFEVVNFIKIVRKDLTSDNLAQILSTRRENCEYDIDGIIVHTNIPYINPEKGNPKYAFAFKMILDTAEAVVEDVEWNASKWGVLKPRIKINPTELSGITINYTTGFNAGFIRDNKINRGSKVLITRSGEIIPYIIEVITQSSSPLLPENENYIWNDTNIDILLIEKNDMSKIKSLVHFFTNLNIEQINEGIMKKLYDNGYDEIEKILNMTKDDFLKIPTIKEKMSEKLYNNIHTKLNSITLPELMCASSIFGMGLGKKKAEALCKGIPNIIEDFKKIKVEDINKLEGFSTKTSEKIIQNLENFVEFYERMKKYFKISAKETVKNNTFENQYIVFSGFRDSSLEEKITSGGGSIQSAVNKKTTLLLVKSLEEESTKIKKAKELNIKILELKNFT